MMEIQGLGRVKGISRKSLLFIGDRTQHLKNFSPEKQAQIVKALLNDLPLSDGRKKDNRQLRFWIKRYNPNLVEVV